MGERDHLSFKYGNKFRPAISNGRCEKYFLYNRNVEVKSKWYYSIKDNSIKKSQSGDEKIR